MAKKKAGAVAAAQCPITNCRQRLVEGMKAVCGTCKKDFCKFHVYPSDHECGQPGAAGASASAPKKEFTVVKASKSAVATAKVAAAAAAAPTADIPSSVAMAGIDGLTADDCLEQLSSLSVNAWAENPLLVAIAVVSGAATDDFKEVAALLRDVAIASRKANTVGTIVTKTVLPLVDLAISNAPDAGLQRAAGKLAEAFGDVLGGSCDLTGAEAVALESRLIGYLKGSEKVVQTGALHVLSGAYARAVDANALGFDEAKSRCEALLTEAIKATDAADKLNAALRLAGLVGGFGPVALNQWGLMELIVKPLGSKSKKLAPAAEASLCVIDALCRGMGQRFVPLAIKYQIFQLCVTQYATGAASMRTLAKRAAKSIALRMNGHGVSILVPLLFDYLNDTAWRSKVLALTIMGDLGRRDAPKLFNYLPHAVPKVMDCVSDTKKEVSAAAQSALDDLSSVVTNPETIKLLPWLLNALKDPSTIDACLDELLDMTFVNSIDSQSLALIIPVITRGLREGSAEMCQKAATTAGNVCSLVRDVEDMKPFAPLLMPELEKCTEHSRPRVRELAIRAKESLDKDLKACPDTSSLAASHDSVDALLHAILSKPELVAEDALDKVTMDFAVSAVEDIFLELAEITRKLTIEFLEARIFERVGGLLRSAVNPEMAAPGAQVYLDLAHELVVQLVKVRGMSVVKDNTREMLVDLHDIILAFPSRVLLQRTDLIMERGQRYAFVGMNGVGKTTLLNRIAAKDINGFPAKVRTYYVQHEIMEEDRALTVTGYMQRPVLSESDVDLAAGKPDTSDETVAVALKKVGFSEALAASPVANLSGGWRMRLAIARSMLYSADLLLLDEPTNHLDHAAISWLENYLCALEGTTIGVVSHDYDFLTVVATDIIHIHDLQLSYYGGGFKEFQRQCPQIVAGLPKPKKSMQTGAGASSNMDSAAAAALTEDSSAAVGDAGAGHVHGIATGDEGESALDRMAAGGDGDNSGIKPIKFPEPGKLEGITSRGKPIMRMTDVEFSYPGTEKIILSGLNCSLSQNSRVALLGPNGAGKSTLLKLLVGEQEVDMDGGDKGKVWRHHNLRTAYIAQHSMHHLEEAVELTPCQYIQRRFYHGRDKELSKMKTLSLTAAEEEQSQQRGEVIAIHSRVQRGKKMYYEIEKVGRTKNDKIKDYRSLQELEGMGRPHVVKLVRMFDEELKAVASGMDIRPLTAQEMVNHLKDFGIPDDLAQRKIRWMSGGQKSRLVLAAAMWAKPHLIALDEPTNYLDNETLAALTHALKFFKGGVITVSHHEAFVQALCKELWHVENGKTTVELLEVKKKRATTGGGAAAAAAAVAAAAATPPAAAAGHAVTNTNAELAAALGVVPPETPQGSTANDLKALQRKANSTQPGMQRRGSFSDNAARPGNKNLKQPRGGH